MRVLSLLLDAYTWVIILRAIASWVPDLERSVIGLGLRRMTEPVLAPLRKVLSPSTLGGIDVSPILAIIAIQLVKRLLWGLAL